MQITKLHHIKGKILIVDDNAETRTAIKLTLESGTNGTYVFKSASTVSSGLKAIASFQPDLIILDLHLPGQNGFDFLDSLKDYNFSESNVVLLTADNSLKNLWEAESKGVNAYHFIGKPFEGDELRALILGMLLAQSREGQAI
jgi:CheY-like chemotaxis protein